MAPALNRWMFNRAPRQAATVYLDLASSHAQVSATPCSRASPADLFRVVIRDYMQVKAGREGSKSFNALRAEAAIGKADIKMSFPIVLFSLPALFVVVLVPAFRCILRNLSGGIGARWRSDTVTFAVPQSTHWRTDRSG